MTAVSHLPVSSGKVSQDVWHCVVVGYASGAVEVVAADSGQALVRKQLHPSRVLAIRCLRALVNPLNPLAAVLSVARLQDLVVVYEGGVLATVESSVLFNTLTANRTEAVKLAKGIAGLFL